MDLSVEKLKSAMHVHRTWFAFAFKRQGWRVFLPSVLGGFALAAQVASISVVFLYVRHLVTGDAFIFHQWQIPARDSLLVLSIFCAMSLVLMLLWAFLTYLYNKRAIDNCTQFEKLIAEKIIEKIVGERALDVPSIEGDSSGLSTLRLIFGDSRCCGRAYFVGAQSLVPFATAIVGVGVLIKTNALLTVALLPLFAMYAYFVSRVNLQGVRDSRQQERIRPLLKEKIKDLMRSVADNSRLMAPTDATLSSIRTHYQNYVLNYSALVSIPFKSSLVNDLFLSLGSVLVLFGLSYSSLLREDSWAMIATYLVALRYTVNASKQLTSKLGVLNRFVPQISRVFEFLNDSEGVKMDAGNALSSKILILSDEPINRLNLLATVRAMVQSLGREYPNPVILTRKDLRNGFAKEVLRAEPVSIVMRQGDWDKMTVQDRDALISKQWPLFMIGDTIAPQTFNADFGVIFMKGKLKWTGPLSDMPVSLTSSLPLNRERNSFLDVETDDIE